MAGRVHRLALRLLVAKCRLYGDHNSVWGERAILRESVTGKVWSIRSGFCSNCLVGQSDTRAATPEELADFEAANGAWMERPR